MRARSPASILAAIAAVAVLGTIGCDGGAQGTVTPPAGPVLTGAVQRSDTGAPIVGAVVILHPSGARAGTDASGGFSFGSWGVGGATEISAQADGYQTVRQPLDGVSTHVVISLPYLGLGSVAGWITDQEGRPVSDVRAEVAGAAVSTTSAGAGYYRIDRVPAGMQVLLFGSPGYRTLSSTVSVRDGQDEVRNVALDRSAHTAAIRGRVFDVGTGVASRPIRGATISIPDRHTPVVSDQDGNYAVFELDEGWTGVLTASATGYVTRELHVRDPLAPGYTTVDAPLYAPGP
jgi:hypothetical protein